MLEEIDSKKRNADEVGRNARYVSRLLDELGSRGRSMTASAWTAGAPSRCELNHRSFQQTQELFGDMTNDNRILCGGIELPSGTAENKKAKKKAKPVILVSKDTMVRIKADVMGITGPGLFDGSRIRGQTYSAT